MRTSIEIDEALLRAAKEVSDARTDADAVRQGLELLFRLATARRLSRFRGGERDARDVPQRRPNRSRHPATR